MKINISKAVSDTTYYWIRTLEVLFVLHSFREVIRAVVSCNDLNKDPEDYFRRKREEIWEAPTTFTRIVFKLRIINDAP